MHVLMMYTRVAVDDDALKGSTVHDDAAAFLLHNTAASAQVDVDEDSSSSHGTAEPTQRLLPVPVAALVLSLSGGLTAVVVSLLCWHERWSGPATLSAEQPFDPNLRFRPLLWHAANASESTTTRAALVAEAPWHSELSQCPVLFEPTFSGSGFGDQLLTYTLNMQVAAQAGVGWLHSGLVADAARWNSFLGIGLGEPDEAAALLQLGARPSQVVRLQLDSALGRYDRHVSDQLPLLQAIADTLCSNNSLGKVDNVTLQASLTGNSSYNALWDTAQHRLLIVKSFLGFPMDDLPSCLPQMYAALRRKYCLTRVLFPLASEVLALLGDNAEGVLRVAVHYRAGDIAHTLFRKKRWEFSELVMALEAVHQALVVVRQTGEFGSALQRWEFHIHSQSPYPEDGKVVLWQEYFAPVINHFNGSSGLLHWHVDTKSEVTIFDLVRSPLLLRSVSGFAVAASLLRPVGVDIVSSESPLPCWQVDRTLQVDLHSGQPLSADRLRKQLRHYFVRHKRTFYPVTYTHASQCGDPS